MRRWRISSRLSRPPPMDDALRWKAARAAEGSLLVPFFGNGSGTGYQTPARPPLFGIHPAVRNSTSRRCRFGLKQSYRFFG